MTAAPSLIVFIVANTDRSQTPATFYGLSFHKKAGKTEPPDMLRRF